MPTRNVPAAYPTILAAVQAAAPGDVIRVSAGYAGNESVAVSVDGLKFDIPGGVPSVRLQAGPGVKVVTLAGDAAVDVSGNDNVNTLTGNSGANRLRGGLGKDKLNGGAGVDTADYSDKTTSVAVVLNGATNVGVKVDGVGEDVVRNIENVVGGSGDDKLTGDGLANRLEGGAGNDTLLGGSGDDVLVGGAGNDILDGGAGVDTVSYENATDFFGLTVDLLAGTTQQFFAVTDTLSGIENVLGSAGSDQIIGDGNANFLWGGAGNDLLRGGAGNDTLDGGEGYDFADYSDKTVSVAVALNGTASVSVKVNGVVEDTIRNFERVAGGSGNDKLTGDAFGNEFEGGAGNDVLKGAAGDDLLSGGSGKDQLDGGAGQDRASYRDKTGAVFVALNGAATVNVEINGVVEDRISNIEGIHGGGGNDELIGDSSDNWFAGGAGKDILDGGAGRDTADYFDAFQGISVTLAGGKFVNVLVNGVVEDTIRNIENVTGGFGQDKLVGDGLDNVFGYSFGNDTMDGAAGVDTADYGSLGNDVTVTLDGSNYVNVKVNGSAETDRIRNIENFFGGHSSDKLTGDGRANRLEGGNGNDMLNGGAGNDILAGNGNLLLGNDAFEMFGPDNDVLTGGAGKDQFVFDGTPDAAFNLDRITDFNVADDTIVLENAVFTAFTSIGTVAASAFHIGVAAHDADDRIIYNSATGGLFYDSNGSASGGVAQIAELSAGLSLTHKNFLIS